MRLRPGLTNVWLNTRICKFDLRVEDGKLRGPKDGEVIIDTPKNLLINKDVSDSIASYL